MDETLRTMIYVILAVVSLGVASLSGPSVPKAPAQFSDVGKLFYPDFTDASAAKSLQVVTYNPETASVRAFGVEQGPDGVWRIPSRNNYPVDGKDRLSKTATSIMSIKREAVAGQRKTQHAEFGTLDPLADSVSDFKGVGNRVILKDGKGGKTLVDLIIGKEVKGRNGYFYVRNPNEDPVYIAKVSLDLSTKFTDWIEPDLLKLDSSKLRTVIINKHSLEISQNGRAEIKGEETNRLTRGSAPGDKWKLDGLNEATEELNEEEVRKLVQSLDDLKIIGIRPKSDKLKKSLEDDKGLAVDQRIMAEMQDMGYFFLPAGKRRTMSLISQEGELYAGTEQGVMYDLRFGAAFTGDEEEVEAGFINQSGQDKKPEPKKDAKGKLINSRYLFVQAFFDPESVGPKPVEPVKPDPPEEEAKKDNDQPAQDDADKTEDKSKKLDPKKVYEATMALYQADLKKYEADLKSYEEKLKAGEKQVKDLNRRFAEWYYVISGESFESLRQGRKTLVKEKPAANKPAEAKTDEQPAKEDSKPEDKKPDDKKPENEEKKPEDDAAPK